MVEPRLYTPNCDAFPEDLFSLLSKYGLDGALLVQPSFLGADNSYLLKVLEDYFYSTDITLRGVVVLDPLTPVDAAWLKELDEMGIVGARLNCFSAGKNYLTMKYGVKRWQQSKSWAGTLSCSARLSIFHVFFLS